MHNTLTTVVKMALDRVLSDSYFTIFVGCLCAVAAAAVAATAVVMMVAACLLLVFSFVFSILGRFLGPTRRRTRRGQGGSASGGWARGTTAATSSRRAGGTPPSGGDAGAFLRSVEGGGEGREGRGEREGGGKERGGEEIGMAEDEEGATMGTREGWFAICRYHRDCRCFLAWLLLPFRLSALTRCSAFTHLTPSAFKPIQ